MQRPPLQTTNTILIGKQVEVETIYSLTSEVVGSGPGADSGDLLAREEAKVKGHRAVGGLRPADDPLLGDERGEDEGNDEATDGQGEEYFRLETFAIHGGILFLALWGI